MLLSAVVVVVYVSTMKQGIVRGITMVLCLAVLQESGALRLRSDRNDTEVPAPGFPSDFKEATNAKLNVTLDIRTGTNDPNSEGKADHARAEKERQGLNHSLVSVAANKIREAHLDLAKSAISFQHGLAESSVNEKYLTPEKSDEPLDYDFSMEAVDKSIGRLANVSKNNGLETAHAHVKTDPTRSQIAEHKRKFDAKFGEDVVFAKQAGETSVGYIDKHREEFLRKERLVKGALSRDHAETPQNVRTWSETSKQMDARAKLMLKQRL